MALFLQTLDQKDIRSLLFLAVDIGLLDPVRAALSMGGRHLSWNPLAKMEAEDSQRS